MTSFSEEIIKERIYRAYADLLFSSREKVLETLRGLQNMEPGDVRVGEAARDMISMIEKGQSPVERLRQLQEEISGASSASKRGHLSEKSLLPSAEGEQGFHMLAQSWSTDELADIFGSSPATVLRWQKGSSPSLLNQKKIDVLLRAINELGAEEGKAWIEERKEEIASWRKGEAPLALRFGQTTA